MSKYDNILPVSNLEQLRLYDPESEMVKQVGGKMRFVFEKMFKNTDVNIDDFYFAVSDEEKPNAAFISAKHTADKKTNIIFVTVGLLEKLKNIEELAAIIAHESGHYIWNELLGGRNTLFQERAADIHSVDLLINAGYNPRYILNVLNTLNSFYDVSGLSFDVHGVPVSRPADVEAYITKISNERGVFDEVDNTTVSPEWDTLVKDVYNIRKKDGYLTYIESGIQKQFGTRKINSVPNNDLFKFLIKELNAGNINNKARIDNLMYILRSTTFLKKADKDLIYQLLMTVFDKLDSVIHFDNHTTIDSLCIFITNSGAESTGVFKQLINDRREFINAVNSFDKESAEEFAEKIDKAGFLNKYVISFSDFSSDKEKVFPQGEKNKGYQMPWEEINNGTTSRVQSVFTLYFKPEYIKTYNKEELKKYAFEEKNGKQIVVAYGKEAESYNKQKINELYDIVAEYQIKEETERFNNLNLLAKLGRGEISVVEYIGIIKKQRPRLSDIQIFYDITKLVSKNDKSILKFRHVFKRREMEQYQSLIDMIDVKNTIYFETHPLYPYKNVKLQEFYKQIINSDFYNYFIKPDKVTSAKSILDIENNLDSFNIDVLEYEIGSFINLASYNWLYKKYIDILFKFYDYFSSVNDEHSMKTVCSNIESYLSNFYEDKTSNHIYEDVLKKQNKLTYRSKVIKLSVELQILEYPERLSRINFVGLTSYKVALLLSKNKYIFNNRLGTVIFKAIEKDIINGKNSVVLDNLLGVMGDEFPKTISDFKRIINKPEYFEITGFLIADYIKRGYDFSVNCLLDLSSVYNKGDCVTMILSNWLTYNNVFNSINLVDKIKLYELFSKEDLFYKKNADKNELIKLIVDEIIKTNSVQYAENILMRANYLTGDITYRKNDDLEFVVQREQLIDFMADYYAKQLGRDNKSKDFEQKAQEIADYISGNINNTEKRFSYAVAKGILEKISQKVVAQEKIARIFDDAAIRKLNNKTAEKYDYYGRAVDNIFVLLSKEPECALAGIEFLNQKLSDKSIKSLNEKLKDKIPNTDLLDKQNLTIMHQNFWAADLEVRAYLMSRLLNAYSKDNNKKIDLVVDLFFDKESAYYKDAKLVIESFYNNLEEYERNLVLAAVTAASQRDDDNTITGGETIGRGLKMFFAAKGAAFIKFGQLLSYMPMLDSDIRKELSTMRDNAKIPTRMDLFNMINETLPKSERDKITYVGKILGAGSFFVTVQVQYDGKNTVLALKRPYTNELTESGMNLINKTIDDLIKADSKYAPLKNIAVQAKDSAKSEIDIDIDYKKYQDAINIYEGFSVRVADAEYKPDVARWITHGKSQDGEYAYKIMEMAPGESLISNTMTEQEKHDAAIAYVTLELSILLSGQKWDTDRHQGQQNFYNSSFRNFMIGVFDTGAQMDKKPQVFDKVLLGALLYSLVNSVRAGKSVSDVLMNSVKKIDNFAEKFNKDTSYIDGVQRGLTALSDIIEYQKEIKDSNGKIIQESKSLTTDDMVKIVGAIYKSGVVDKTVKRSVVASAIIDNIIPDKGLLKLLKLLEEKSDDSEIVVAYTPVDKSRKKRSVFAGLTQKEIKEIQAKKGEQKHLGIRRGWTEKKDNLPLTEHKLAMGF